ncbi:MAG TPA: MATE family efflux transporter [Patescibacteria group bacterium]|nr:MATE family efflux transporter [Patescibacteria group bacterium]
MTVSIQKTMRGQILQLAWPVITEGLAVMAVNVLVTAMVGRLGAVALAGVALATLIQSATVMILAAAGTGAAAIVARETGAGNWPEVRRVAGQAVLLGLLLGGVLALTGVGLAGPLLSLTGAEPDVLDLAADLVRILLAFSPFILTLSIGNAVLRGMGLTRLSFYVTAAGNSVSLLMSWQLIFGVGLPQLGVYGAVWGTGIGQVFGALISLLLLVRQEHVRLRWGQVMTWHRETVERIARISIPTVLEQTALQGGRMVFTFMLAGVGTAQFAGHQIALQVESMSFMPGFGLCVAAMTLVGQNLGRGLPHRAEQYARMANRIAFWGMAAVGAFMFLFARELTSLFIQDPEVIYWGTLCVMIAVLEQPTLGSTMVLGGVLRGAGDTRWPMYVTAIGVWIFRMPLGYLFILVWGFDITAGWYITAVDFLVRTVIFWRRFTSGKWRSVNY